MASGFNQFEVVTDYSDHIYAKDKTAKCFASGTSKVFKKIMHEWKVLGESLPDTIYVRTYEGRIDLLRAVIIGARGTPYHDGLFFFDIALPVDYPNSPPKVCYRSFGLRVNPNLYENGFVCLSLLNTWRHRNSCEMWNPNCSSILQVLVSIQGLVLNAKPYYNEPGYKSAPNYKVYNEEVFALSCTTMLYTLRAPPLHFKEFVTLHFTRHGYYILKAMKAYRNGSALVGQYYETVASGGKQKKLKVSTSLVENLDYLYKLLFADFSKIKAHGIEKLKPSIESASQVKHKQGNTKRNSILCNLWSILKNFFKIVDKKSP